MEQAKNTRKIILIVEDERALLKVIAKKFDMEGFDTRSAVSVQEAFHWIEQEPAIAAIWLDHYLLGGQSGLDLIAQLKSKNDTRRSIPVFVVSIADTPDKIQSYSTYGVQKYFSKSESRLDDIISEIKKSIGGPGNQRG